MEIYVKFDGDGRQVAYHEKDMLGINDEVSYLAPEGFDPLLDVCTLEDGQISILAGQRDRVDKENRLRAKQEHDVYVIYDEAIEANRQFDLNKELDEVRQLKEELKQAMKDLKKS